MSTCAVIKYDSPCSTNNCDSASEFSVVLLFVQIGCFGWVP